VKVERFELKEKTREKGYLISLEQTLACGGEPESDLPATSYAALHIVSRKKPPRNAIHPT
jgi:hypothetical protein